MHVAKFFDAFVFGPNVEIVEPFLPDVLRDVVEQNSLSRIAVAASPALERVAQIQV